MLSRFGTINPSMAASPNLGRASYSVVAVLAATMMVGMPVGAQTQTETPADDALYQSRPVDQATPLYQPTTSTVKSGSIVALYSRPSNPFNALVGKPRVRRDENSVVNRVQRFVLSEGERAFLFQESANGARIQFLCDDKDERMECQVEPNGNAEEIYQLQTTRAPRGDVIYKNASGQTVLRIASYGGATVWWPGDSEARAASKSFSDRQFLALRATSREAIARRVEAATTILSEKTGAAISFDIGSAAAVTNQPAPVPQLSPESFGGDVGVGEAEDEPAEEELAAFSVLADSVVVTSKGMANVANDATGARVLGSRVRAVRFVEDEAASVTLDNGVLIIRYNSASGLEGRPSSATISQFLENNL